MQRTFTNDRKKFTFHSTNELNSPRCLTSPCRHINILIERNSSSSNYSRHYLSPRSASPSRHTRRVFNCFIKKPIFSKTIYLHWLCHWRAKNAITHKKPVRLAVRQVENWWAEWRQSKRLFRRASLFRGFLFLHLDARYAFFLLRAAFRLVAALYKSE